MAQAAAELDPGKLRVTTFHNGLRVFTACAPRADSD
jgi:hypothetical protein